MARTSVYSIYDGQIDVDELIKKIKTKGWNIQLFNNADQCKPFRRINVDDCYIVGFKESENSKGNIVGLLDNEGVNAISELKSKGLLGDIRLAVSKDFDAPSWFISEHGPEMWDDIKQTYPNEIVKYYEAAKIYIELDNWEYAEKTGVSKELMKNLALSLDEQIGAMIEDDDSGEFFINGKVVWKREVNEENLDDFMKMLTKDC